MRQFPILYNTTGVSRSLNLSRNRIHILVEEGRLGAHIFNVHGEFVPYVRGTKRQGQGLYFTEDDLAAYVPGKVGRPRGIQ